MILKSKAWDEKEKRFRNIEIEIPEENEKIIFSMKVLEEEERGSRGQLPIYKDSRTM